MSSKVDYSGRRIDVHCMYPVASGAIVLRLAAPGQGGLAVAGVRRLAERFTAELLTEQGSMRYAAQRGTRLLADLRTGVVQSPVDLLASLSRAISQVATVLQTETDGDTPEDEQLTRVNILSVDLQGAHATVRMQLESKAGASRTVLVPLAVPVRG